MNFQRHIAGGYLRCSMISDKKIKFFFIDQRFGNLYSTSLKKKHLPQHITQHHSEVKDVFQFLSKIDQITYIGKGQIKFQPADRKYIKIIFTLESEDLPYNCGQFIGCLLSLLKRKDTYNQQLQKQLREMHGSRRNEHSNENRRRNVCYLEERPKDNHNTQKLSRSEMIEKKKEERKAIETKRQESNKLEEVPVVSIKADEMIKEERPKEEHQLEQKNEETKTAKPILQYFDSQNNEVPSPETGLFAKDHPDYGKAQVLQTWDPICSEIPKKQQNYYEGSDTQDYIRPIITMNYE